MDTQDPLDSPANAFGRDFKIPPGVVVHPRAICESSMVGVGTRLWAFSHVQNGAVLGCDCNVGEHVYIETGARIGDRVIIKNQVMIWEGVTVEDEVFVGPGVIFTNDRYPRSRRMPEASQRYERSQDWLCPTLVRRGASIGGGAVILPGLTIGRYASVGAGAVVTRDVAEHRLVVGNPARAVGWVCVCGVSLSEQGECVQCGRKLSVDSPHSVVV